MLCCLLARKLRYIRDRHPKVFAFLGEVGRQNGKKVLLTRLPHWNVFLVVGVY